MSPRKGKPKQDAKGEEALSSAERKLARSKKKGSYEYPGLIVRRARRWNT
jgi:hypothetical protein